MKNKHYHFIGIGGIGMGALANLLIDQGLKVSGSDLRDNQMTEKLSQKGAIIFRGHSADNISGADCVIFSTAVDSANCELNEAKDKNIRILRRAELLAEMMQGYTGITVAGAHGKTTTSSMISNMLVTAGLEPTSAIGGIVNKMSNNARLGTGKYFVAEADESDGSFLNFLPRYSVITNIDLEHLDYYGSWENILKAYQDYVARTADDGIVIGCGDDERLMNILKAGNAEYKTYGFSDDNYVRAENISHEGFASSYDLIVAGQKIDRVFLVVPGNHNILNSLGCVTLGLILSIDLNIILKSLKNFSGVKRRFQVVGEVNDIYVIDDYAHHPTEIDNILHTANKCKKDRLITIFQPHRYSRLASLMSEFARSLINTDYLIVTDIYAASEAPIDGISSESLVENVKKLTNKPVVYLTKNEVVGFVSGLAAPNDMILALGAGDVTKISSGLVELIKDKYKSLPCK